MDNAETFSNRSGGSKNEPDVQLVSLDKEKILDTTEETLSLNV